VTPMQCASVHRLRIVLQRYHDFIEDHSGVHGINNLKNRGIAMYIFISRTLNNYSTVRLLDDYHFVISNFSSQLHDVHEILVSDMGDIDVATSIIFQRINRNRQECAFRNDKRCEHFGGYNASEEVSVQKLLDKIYCHLILAFEAGYILTRHQILQIASKQIEESQQIYYGHEQQGQQQQRNGHGHGDADKDDAIDSALQIIVNITAEKRKTLQKVRGKRRMTYNKFVTQVPSDDDDDDELLLDDDSDVDDEKQAPAPRPAAERIKAYEMDFGYPFKYWSSYRDNAWYVAAKYENLKSEMMRNTLCQLSYKQFEDDIKNAINFKNCKRGRKMKCHYTMHTYNEPSERELKIKPLTPISIDHMLALLLFCNYDILRKHIASTYQKQSSSSTDADVRRRHSEYGHICRWLYEAIRLYGTDMAQQEPTQAMSVTFYHCFSRKVYFEESHCFFSYPASTTTSLSVINMYCPSTVYGDDMSDGLLVQCRKNSEYEGDQHYVDCAWFSDHSYESEKLFLHIMLSFKSILYPSLYHNYSQYLNAFTALQSMVVASEMNHNILTPLVPKILKLIIDDKLEQLPQYIRFLFEAFRNTVTAVQINVWLMIIDSYEIMEDEEHEHEEAYLAHERHSNDGNQYGYLKLHPLFIDKDGWIFVDRLAHMFPLTAHIELFNGNIQSGEILPCITLDEMVMNNLLNFLPVLEKNTKLRKISFYNPDEQLLGIDNILKHFTTWFEEIHWNIKLVMKKPPFQQDQMQPLRTLVVTKK